jgi:hypothetical protein
MTKVRHKSGKKAAQMRANKKARKGHVVREKRREQEQRMQQANRKHNERSRASSANSPLYASW